jgi:hypothetical protein
VLHDVLKDCTDWTFERLETEGFSQAVMEALQLVTKIEGEDYDDFVRRAAGNPISRAVKMADLEDNMDLSRIADVTTKTIERIEDCNSRSTVSNTGSCALTKRSRSKNATLRPSSGMSVCSSVQNAISTAAPERRGARHEGKLKRRDTCKHQNAAAASAGLSNVVPRICRGHLQPVTRNEAAGWSIRAPVSIGDDLMGWTASAPSGQPRSS